MPAPAPAAAAAPAQAPPLTPPADTTGLYALAAIATLTLLLTGLIYLFTQSHNHFVQTILLPHFHRFGWWSELLVALIGLYAGHQHVARLKLRHNLFRLACAAVIFAALYTQWQLHATWLLNGPPPVPAEEKPNPEA